jgi:hypothetical protein
MKSVSRARWIAPVTLLWLSFAPATAWAGNSEEVNAGLSTIDSDPLVQSEGSGFNFTVIPQAITFSLKLKLKLKENLMAGIGLFNSSIRREFLSEQVTSGHSQNKENKAPLRATRQRDRWEPTPQIEIRSEKEQRAFERAEAGRGLLRRSRSGLRVAMPAISVLWRTAPQDAETARMGGLRDRTEMRLSLASGVF